METMKRDSKRNKRGMVLPLIISIAVVLAILGMGMIRLGFGSRLMSIKNSAGITARAAADAGVTQALYEMNKLFVPGAALPALPADVVNLPLPDATNHNAIYSYHVEGPISDPVTFEDYWLITSTGTSGGETKTVYARASIMNLFEYALIVNDKIVLKSSTLIDGYDSSQGYPSPPGDYPLKIGTNSTLFPPAGGIDLGMDTIVMGDVLVGNGANPEDVIRDHGATTGNRYSLPTPFDFVQIAAPTVYDGPTPNLVGGDLEIVAPLGYTLEDPYTIVASVIDISQGGRLTVVGSVALHITGDIKFGQGSEMYIGIPPDDPDYVHPGDPAFVPSSLDIYLDGNLVGGNAGGINNLSEIPGYFKLFGTGPPYQDWEMKNNRDFFGVYYGPNADIIIKADADVYGSVSGHSYDMRNSGNMHYDVRLSDYDEYNVGFAIYRWWEIVGPPPAPL